MNQSRTPEDVCNAPLPDHPELALFVATLFQRLGGSLEIDGDGLRHAVRPDRYWIWREGIPQLPDSRSRERFHSGEEWQGAIKLVEYWLNRLSAADREHVFTLLASVSVEAEGQFDFRERL